MRLQIIVVPATALLFAFSFWKFTQIDQTGRPVEELDPTYRLLGSDVMNLKVVPFGKALIKMNGTQIMNMTCQHGWGECDANSYEQCAIHLFPDPTWYLPYLVCLFGKLTMGMRNEVFDRAEYFEKCAVIAGLVEDNDFGRIQSCRDEQFWALQKEASSVTKKNQNNGLLEHVPWVNLDGVHYDEQPYSFKNETPPHFSLVVCQAFVKKGGISEACDDILSSYSLSIH
eukprot:scaffold66157_cov52-Attheya_sp.AAC.4